MAVLIIGTSMPRFRKASTARGRSSGARSGDTRPPGRTVKSGPFTPNAANVSTASSKAVPPRWSVNRQMRSANGRAAAANAPPTKSRLVILTFAA